MLKTAGTKNSVAVVAQISPPMTARPSGAFCSALRAVGSIPVTIAVAVIGTGRKRLKPDSIAALKASIPSAICSRAKLTTRMEFAVATPMHMMAPVSAGTDSVVWVINNIHTIPANAAHKPVTMANGSNQDWKLTIISR